MRRWIYDFCRPLARRRRHLPESVGHLDAVNQPIICNGLENSDRNMYRLPVARCNDARLGGGPPPAEGPRATQTPPPPLSKLSPSTVGEIQEKQMKPS